MFGLSLACLFFFHLYLIARNRSTIETVRPPFLENGPCKNAYHLGIFNNFKQVFGNQIWKWPIPISSSIGSGSNFPLASSNTSRYSTASHNNSIDIETGTKTVSSNHSERYRVISTIGNGLSYPVNKRQHERYFLLSGDPLLSDHSSDNDLSDDGHRLHDTSIIV